MQRRALLSVVNIAVATGALLVVFLYPRYAGYAIYVFLGWFVVSFSLVWAARGPAPTAGAAAPGTTAASGGPAAPASAASRPLATTVVPAPPEVGFCIYCAADLRPGSDSCPACGHARARLA